MNLKLYSKKNDLLVKQNLQAPQQRAAHILLDSCPTVTDLNKISVAGRKKLMRNKNVE